MLPVVWMESFSEEEETVKRVSSLTNEIIFFEPPIQQLDQASLPDEYIASIRTHSRFTETSVRNVACVISRSTGYDHLVEQQAVLASTPAGYLSEYATQAVAEHNLTVSLALLKDLNRQQSAMNRFERNNLTGYDLSNRSVGIVGVGKIGEATARLFMGLGLTVKGHDIEEKPRLRDSGSFSYCSLRNLFETCDLVVLCLPHTEQTEGLITSSLLRSMPEKSFLVNAGRGEVVPARTLLEGLRDGSLRGIGLDVYNREEDLSRRLRTDATSDTTHPEVEATLELIEDERVIATPHNAFNSLGAIEKKVERTLDNIRSFNESKTLLNPVS